jgi:hypothetical protein
MALPVQPNVTVQIHHNSAFGVPTDILNVPGFLTADYARHTESGEKDSYAFRFTHTLLIDSAVYAFDTYDAGAQPGGSDSVIWPSGGGITATDFTVIFVETKGRGTPWVHLKLYLDRGVPPWPTTRL